MSLPINPDPSGVGFLMYLCPFTLLLSLLFDELHNLPFNQQITSADHGISIFLCWLHGVRDSNLSILRRHSDIHFTSRLGCNFANFTEICKYSSISCWQTAGSYGYLTDYLTLQTQNICYAKESLKINA